MFDKFKNKKSLHWVPKAAEDFHSGYEARSWAVIVLLWFKNAAISYYFF